MARSIWTGSISFGLINIPVKMFTATRSKQLHFHLLHRKDHARLQQKMVCSADKKEVPRTEAVKGYEFSPDHMVVVDPKELESLMPKSSRALEVLDFVQLSQIDSIYFNQPYYLLPDERAVKAYKLFFEAMQRTKKVAIASYVMRNKQYLAALRPMGRLICLETMYYADEIVSPDKLEDLPKDVAVNEKELKMAEQLIGSLTIAWKPQKYHDEYRDAVLELIEKKARGKQIVVQHAPAKGPKIVDLMSALEASLKETKKKKKAA
jgi:DNA end-binding protein Ku